MTGVAGVSFLRGAGKKSEQRLENNKMQRSHG
jgi:hypothetical protein